MMFWCLILALELDWLRLKGQTQQLQQHAAVAVAVCITCVIHHDQQGMQHIAVVTEFLVNKSV